ncbi:hypothetical protein D9M68_428790 [compost metagenome]
MRKLDPPTALVPCEVCMKEVPKSEAIVPEACELIEGRRAAMRISLQLVVQDDGGAPATVTEIAQFERDGLDVGSLGLHLDEAKSLLVRLQRTMVAAQVAEAVARTSVCPTCGAQLACKGHHHLVFRSAFGRLSIDSPRLYRCRQCQGDAPTFSPVARCLPERVSPELQYLEVKFAALMSYGLTVNVLQEVLPLDHVLAASSIRRQVTKLGRRLEGGLTQIKP